MKKLINHVKLNYALLKANFIWGASNSNFPTISIGEFTLMCKKFNFADKNVPQSTIDRFFIAVNVELENQDHNPDKELMRFEFIELLVRIANEKFCRFGPCTSFFQAFKTLMDVHIIPNGEQHHWQEFRETDIWTIDVNDVLLMNLDSLRTIYDSYSFPTKQFMTKEDFVDLFMQKTDLGMQERDVVYSFGMSKMTVVNENSEDGERQYNKLLFVEFLEAIARVAHQKFRDSELSQLALHHKIEHILDELFVHFGLTRSTQGIVEEEVTDSDSDY